MVNKGNKSRTENISFDLWWRKSMYTHSLLLFVFVHTIHTQYIEKQSNNKKQGILYLCKNFRFRSNIYSNTIHT